MEKSFNDAKILIATPCSLETIYKAWFESFMNLQKPTHWGFRMDSALPISVNRNNTVRAAMEQGYEYIFFLDHDQVLPNDTLARLWQYQKPVVGSLYFERGYPHLPLCYLFNPEQNQIAVATDYPKGLAKCDVLGVGCSLWETSVFKGFTDPWFEYNDGINQWGTEDIVVFKKLKTAGIPVHCDTQFPVGHLGMRVVNEPEFQLAKPKIKDWLESPEGKKALCRLSLP